MITKKFILDNVKGDFKEVVISSGPNFDFLKNQARIKVYNLLSEDISDVLESEYLSTKLLDDKSLQSRNQLFVPIGKSKYVFDILIIGCIEEDVEEFSVIPI